MHRRDVRGRAGLYDGAGQPYSGKDTGGKGDPGLCVVAANSAAEISGQLMERSVWRAIARSATSFT